MRCRFDTSDFFDHVNEIESSGLRNPMSDEVRLSLANMAVEVIENEGGVVQSDDLYSYAMTGLPTLGRAEPPETHREFTHGLWAVERQFTQATADIPFLPPRVQGNGVSYFLPRGYSARVPYWVSIRGQEPYEQMPSGWGLEPDDSSLEFRVARNPLTSEVVGRIVARGCFHVSMQDILGEGATRLRQVGVKRDDVTLYEARRDARRLPDKLPRVKPARFALDTLQTKGVEWYRTDGDRLAYGVGLAKAARAAQHRGDYRGLPVMT